LYSDCINRTGGSNIGNQHQDRWRKPPRASLDRPARSKAFYGGLLGFPSVLDTDGAFVFLAGATVIGVLAPDTETAPGDRFSSSRVGVDHIALSSDDMPNCPRRRRAL
jgi:catechol 2,3-dioxygenase-like lactoylglutathione lyase family enzyme